MKRLTAIAILLLAVFLAGKAFVLPQDVPDRPALQSFGQLPVIEGGRLKPLDSLARNLLLACSGKQSIRLPSGDQQTPSAKIPAIRFLADLALSPAQAAQYPVFRVDDPDLLSIFGHQGKDVRFYSFAELEDFFPEIERQTGLVPEEPAMRTRYHRALLRLRQNLFHYQKLQSSFVAATADLAPSAEQAYLRLAEIAPAGMAAIAKASRQETIDREQSGEFLALADRFRAMAENGDLRLVPPLEGAADLQRWQNNGLATLAVTRAPVLDAVPLLYARLSDAWRAEKHIVFNAVLQDLHQAIETRYPEHRQKIALEYFYNHLQPFLVSLELYLLVFLVAFVSFLGWTKILQRAAFHVLLLATLLHTLGLVLRVYLSGYAPVTNLYSSAIFVGWGAVLFCGGLEAVFRNGLGSIAAAIIGFCTLIIAHNLALSGGVDTMEQMRAVLDSNFWLSTHVTTITIGYSATFVAGILALLYVFLGLATRQLTASTAASLDRMVYGISCFALFFSFVGTVLGGIWADQSWGRFWGWDPKENGALMIVLWVALALHAKRIRMVSRRGFMLLAIGGNIVTSWSWFGTNMLGVGLHSYGFMDQAFYWLLAFWGSQAFFILLGNLDERFWRSRGNAAPAQLPVN